ncbi:MAG TPA: NAD(P)H-dependent glycerol-3-phosphate dehydrogenase [Aestuariivirgaceae bacterium]|nr:NAD(P)H-dependent glycerol-3-phosphate dehydrogenase [Aestuariivirgaceae bacterium]
MTGASTIGIVGAGAWGTALAAIATRAGLGVTLVSRRPQVVESINTHRHHPDHAAGVLLPPGVAASERLADASGADLLLLATPAQSVRGVMAELAGRTRAGLPVLIAAKGLEIGSGKFMSAVAAEASPGIVPFVLSGPSFAADVMAGKPTAVALAGSDLDAASAIARRLSVSAFRIYSSSDMAGVQLGGAVKNVLAIACGIAEGRGLGDSARAALTARAFAELIRLGRSMGALPETLTGLSGLGDLVLTCSSLQSRNFSFGIALGRGARPSELAAGPQTVEGVTTAKALATLIAANDLDLPICRAVHSILFEGLDVDAAVEALLTRPLRPEN